MQSKPKENEIEAYAFAVGVFRWGNNVPDKVINDQIVVMDFVMGQPGFLGFYPVVGRGTLCIFQTEAQAQETRLSLIAAGCPCGNYVGRVFVRKADVEERLTGAVTRI